MDAEDNYDFDAPMFVDFSNRGHFEQEDEELDKWFDNRDGDGGGFEDSLELDNVHHEAETAIEQPQTDQQSTDKNSAKSEAEEKAAPTQPTEEETKKEANVANPFMFFQNKTAPNLTTVPSWRTRVDQAEPPSKKNKSEPATHRSKTVQPAPRRSVRLSSKRSTKPMPKMKAAILTIPSTPSMMRRMKNKSNKTQTSADVHKPREEQELQTIAKMQMELKEKRKQNQGFMKKALSAGNYMPYRSVDDNLTQAHEFHFELDKRIKKPQHAPADTKEKNFFETLRQHPISPSFKNRKPTKQQPFSFQTNQGKKRKTMDNEASSCDGYIPMAQQCYKFQNSTPPRFRTKNATKEDEKQTSKLTCPKTPNLSTKDRKRPLPDDCLSREDEEQRELEEMRNYKFKAQAFDPKIVEKQGTYGLKPHAPKSLTEQQPFNFASDQRVHKEPEVEEKPVPAFKAQPVPEFDKIKFKPELPHTATKQEPFSFEQRDKETLAKKEEKIQNVLEEEKKAREFHAQPLQSFSPMEISSISKPNTKFEPFNLTTDNRGALKAQKWKQTVEEELHELRKKTVFKAHSSNVLYQVPFVPKKSLKSNTTFEEFHLSSELRAQERATYEMNKKEKELHDEQLMLQREVEREEEERRNIAVLRKEMVHKANPIRTYKQVALTASDKLLTLPESPAWNTREKRNMRI